MVTFEDVLEIPDINEVSSAIHKSSRSHISLDEQFKTVVSSGHPWCAFVRDNWSCHGSFYQSVLNDTKLFDRNFSLASARQGLRIYAEGNSYLAQIIISWICNAPSSTARYFKLDGNDTNSLLVYEQKNDLLLLLIDNDVKWNAHPRKTVLTLRNLFDPDVIVVGDLNGFEEMRPQRVNLFLFFWPNALLVSMFGRRFKCNCGADFHDCQQWCGHQCIPGPIIREAEIFAQRIIYDSQFFFNGSNDANYVAIHGGRSLKDS
jgi:hypothetical protein